MSIRAILPQLSPQVAAMIQLAAYRERTVTDPRLSKALRCIENESAQRERLAEQVAFDQSVLEMLGAIAAPPDLRQRLDSAQSAVRGLNGSASGGGGASAKKASPSFFDSGYFLLAALESGSGGSPPTSSVAAWTRRRTPPISA